MTVTIKLLSELLHSLERIAEQSQSKIKAYKYSNMILLEQTDFTVSVSKSAPFAPLRSNTVN